MRIDWDQQLHGFSLLEIRNLLRKLRHNLPFTVPLVAQVLQQNFSVPRSASKVTARVVVDGLLESGLIELSGERPKRSTEWFDVTDVGISLCAANATKRFTRQRADRAVEKLLGVVSEVNSESIYLHDVEWVAVYGSYLRDEPDYGDIDVAVKLKARWTPQLGLKKPTDREIRTEAFERVYPPPESFYEKSFIAFWPETYLMRKLRVDPAIKLIERSQLEAIGCPHRQIYPTVVDVAAQPGWAYQREPILLKERASVESI